MSEKGKEEKEKTNQNFLNARLKREEIYPFLYLVSWLIFICISKICIFTYEDFGSTNIGIFLVLSFCIMFFGMITKSTSWSFFGAKGDSLGSQVRLSKNENGGFNYEGLFSEDEVDNIKGLLACQCVKEGSSDGQVKIFKYDEGVLSLAGECSKEDYNKVDGIINPEPIEDIKGK